ncbi:hypothetical protein ML100_004066 [Klebsiella pneumoniae]|uniref:hypothetical protein n=1 Tax=Klebsiella pneumoniae TaxID=573 RepID=UPI000BCF0F97|nr:hypothetical protein [Klebsiella pneumoniae]HBQ5931724.1 hypothetical protein [Klebsiella pneumoniae subsp. pneumoniae]EIW3889764.1 hypothetical protein [Klebsiella pneumoniae]EIX9657071.1 hypothetical protein [Klebsiella pneumoniae]EIX9668486.1 hypothetical protein [Klebsiella pneumoniae]EIX9677763.1 hypothetical protein [Klebsiella pneumoniae]
MELLIICAIIGCIPAAIASSKGRSFFAWWVYGALLFIVALIHSLIIKKTVADVERKQINEGLVKCPFCAEMIKPEAIKCRHCGSEVEPRLVSAVITPSRTENGTKIRFDRILILVGGIAAILIIIHLSGS